jgi:predicted dienelactone hydrolase
MHTTTDPSSGATGRRDRRRTGLVALIIVLALTGAACSSSDDASTSGGGDVTEPEAVVAPVDYSQRGPYPVGTTVLDLDDRRVYVFYPADPAATATADAVEGYSSSIGFPEDVLPLVPEELIQDIPLDAYRDPAPSPDGPFPTVIHSHGAGDHAAFASQHFEHMASWGFVTASPEHIERDLAASTLNRTVRGDDVAVLRATLGLLREQNEAGPLAGSMNLDQLAAAGLSAGGSAALRFAYDPEVVTVIGRAPAPGVSIEIPDDISADAEARRAYVADALPTAYATTPPPDKPSMLIAGEVDGTIPLANIEAAFDWLAPPKRFAVIAGAGHNSFTDLCGPIRAQGGLMQFSGRLPVPDGLLRRGEDGCTPADIDPEVAYRLIDQLTVAQLRDVFGIDAEVAAASLEQDWLDELFPGALARYTYEP